MIRELHRKEREDTRLLDGLDRRFLIIGLSVNVMSSKITSSYSISTSNDVILMSCTDDTIYSIEVLDKIVI